MHTHTHTHGVSDQSSLYTAIRLSTDYHRKCNILYCWCYLVELEHVNRTACKLNGVSVSVPVHCETVF